MAIPVIFGSTSEAVDEQSAPGRVRLPIKLETIMEQQALLLNKLSSQQNLLEQELLTQFLVTTKANTSNGDPRLKDTRSSSPSQSSENTQRNEHPVPGIVEEYRNSEVSSRSICSSAGELNPPDNVRIPSMKPPECCVAPCPAKKPPAILDTRPSILQECPRQSILQECVQKGQSFFAMFSSMKKIARSDAPSSSRFSPGIFPNAHEIMAKARSTQSFAQYASSTKEEQGIVQRLVYSRLFEASTIFVALLNVLWLWFDVDFNTSQASTEAANLFRVMENVFCGFYVFEYTLRVLALEDKREALQGLLALDCALMVITLWETWLCMLSNIIFDDTLGIWHPSIWRPLRVLRLLRVARLMKKVPGLLVILKTVPAAADSVSYTLFLLVGILYAFAILMRYLTNDEEHFPTVFKAFLTLFFRGILLDSPFEFALVLLSENLPAFISFLFFVVLATLTVMNLLIGVMCQAVSAVAEIERDRISRHKIKEKIYALIMSEGDVDTMHITKHDFKRMLDNLSSFQEMDVDIEALVGAGELMFQSDDSGMTFDRSIHFDEFVDIVMKTRNCNSATVKDIVNLRAFIRKECNSQIRHLGQLEEVVRAHSSNKPGLPSLLSKPLL